MTHCSVSVCVEKNGTWALRLLVLVYLRYILEKNLTETWLDLGEGGSRKLAVKRSTRRVCVGRPRAILIEQGKVCVLRGRADWGWSVRKSSTPPCSILRVTFKSLSSFPCELHFVVQNGTRKRKRRGGQGSVERRPLQVRVERNPQVTDC